jgi:basic membrane protein A and related proteins
MDRRKFTKLAATGVLGAAIPDWAVAAQPGEPLKVGFVYVGPVGDFGWTYQHDMARKDAVAEFGDKIETIFVENVPEGPDSARVMADLAAKGCKLIFATSFGFMNYTINVAKDFPNVMFEHCVGYKRAPNVSTYNIRRYQGRYVEGVIAGKLTKSNTAGYVGSMPIPEVVMGMNAFVLGMRSVNPKATLRFIMVNSWYDPGREGDAAKALIDQGCDVITQHTDSPSPLKIAEVRGVKAFGEANDLTKFAPSSGLSAIINAWSGYYIKRIQDVMDGNWKSTNVWGGFDSGMLKMLPFTNMPPEVNALAMETIAEVTSGKNKVFVGPITDQGGKLQVAPGQVMDDSALLSLQWLVEGVQGKLS